MNHKLLFILSIVVIVVGIGGIFFQNTQHQHTEKDKPEAVAAVSASEREIMVAEALRDLKPYDILTAEDYRLVSLKVSSTMKDYRDISSLSGGNIQGALLRNNVAKGAPVIPSELVVSTDPAFISASLRDGEAPFSFPVLPADAYILSVTHTGDKMDVFIRVIEVERNKNSDVGLVREGSMAAAKSTPKYVTTRLLRDITVLESKRFEKKKEEKDVNKFSREREEEPVGAITIRLNQQQVVELITIAKTGELFLLPQGGDYSAGSKVRMDDILPQFRSVKELRGRK